ncbi:tubulin-specific chaperone B-like [Mercenaria mercenaria]|uniref:tubulin-specific chaperone B-like n=1 Tax=Mercenaria mercenaria TaxID=6596 RepID=UPI00234FA538|nr:tubulin-specific chaperone B-like [Mercenaria mercenaria]
MVTTSKSASRMTVVVQFVGNVEFASGPWVGVELDLPEGKNNGSVNGIPYFRCRPRHGLLDTINSLWIRNDEGLEKVLLI